MAIAITILTVGCGQKTDNRCLSKTNGV